MLDRIRELPGERMALEEYRAEFATVDARASSSWKLERQQDFIETGLPSWDAAAAGDWHDAMRLAHEQLRPIVEEQERPLNARGVLRRRLRIASRPLSTYLRWELPALLIRVEHGEQVRVAAPELVRRYETTAELPEIVGLDHDVMYHILYDEYGALAGGRRITERPVITDCHHEFDQLWAHGTDLADYVRAEVASLVPFLP